jgi:hypothetical protein
VIILLPFEFDAILQQKRFRQFGNHLIAKLLVSPDDTQIGYRFLPTAN